MLPKQTLLARKDIFKTKFIGVNNDEPFFASNGGGLAENPMLQKI